MNLNIITLGESTYSLFKVIYVTDHDLLMTFYYDNWPKWNWAT